MGRARGWEEANGAAWRTPEPVDMLGGTGQMRQQELALASASRGGGDMGDQTAHSTLSFSSQGH